MSDISRRTFLTTTAAGAGLTIVPRHVLGRGFQAPSDTVNIATVGFGGMGGSNTRRLMSQNIVAICDVDDALVDAQLKRMTDDAASMPASPQQAPPQTAVAHMSKAQATANARRPRIDNAAALRRFTSEQIPRLKRYRDYREMLDKQKDIDAIVVATPDHMHAVIALAAMDLNKHVYVQKPLCWSVEEARALAKKAKEKPRVVTQMGNQGHSSDGSRTGYEYIRGGAIGDVREVHVWTNRPLGFWPQGIPRPAPLAAGHERAAAAAFPLRTCHTADSRRAVSRIGVHPVDALVGSLPRRCARRRLPPDLSSASLARMGGLGPGCARRHGRAPDRSSVQGAEPRSADRDRNIVDAVQRRLLIRTRPRPTISSRRAATCRR